MFVRKSASKVNHFLFSGETRRGGALVPPVRHLCTASVFPSKPQARASEQPPKAALSESLIYAVLFCLAEGKCVDPPTPLRVNYGMTATGNH